MKTLSEQDAKLFYRIYYPLLGFVNQKMDEERGVKPEDSVLVITPEVLQQLSMRIWEDPSIIDDYLAATKRLSEEEADVLRDWRKMHISGVFTLMACTKDGGLFYGPDDKVYLVKGIYDPWDTLRRGQDMPVAYNMTILPFRGVIITDGLIMMLKMAQELAAEIKRRFMKEKERGIIQSLN